VLFFDIISAPAISHQPTSSIFLSQQIRTRHPPPASGTSFGRVWLGGHYRAGRQVPGERAVRLPVSGGAPRLDLAEADYPLLILF
jgi:hypothetical protein